MKSDTSEKGLESFIVAAMLGQAPGAVASDQHSREGEGLYGYGGWVAGDPTDYDREYAVDLVQFAAFIKATQEHLVEPLDLEHDGPTRQKFLARLQGEVTKRGVVDVLRRGVKHGPHHIDFFYGTPTPETLARKSATSKTDLQ